MDDDHNGDDDDQDKDKDEDGEDNKDGDGDDDENEEEEEEDDEDDNEDGDNGDNENDDNGEDEDDGNGEDGDEDEKEIGGKIPVKRQEILPHLLNGDGRLRHRPNCHPPGRVHDGGDGVVVEVEGEQAATRQRHRAHHRLRHPQGEVGLGPHHELEPVERVGVQAVPDVAVAVAVAV